LLLSKIAKFTGNFITINDGPADYDRDYENGVIV